MAVVIPFETHERPSIDDLVHLVTSDMERVNATILTRTGSEVTMIPESPTTSSIRAAMAATDAHFGDGEALRLPGRRPRQAGRGG